MLDFHAGKYAAFVWPAYGLTVLIIGALAADTLARARRWRRAVEAREAELAAEPPPEPLPPEPKP
jgi:heme exporter protein D